MNLKCILGIVSYSIDYQTPAVLYFVRNWQMVQGRTLNDLAGATMQQVLPIDVL